MKKICGVFIDKTYGIYHAISILIELSRDKNNNVFILSRVQNVALIKSILEKYKCEDIKLIILRPYWYFPLSHYLEIKLQLRRVLFFKYRKLFRTFDGVLCTMYLDLGLKKIISSDKTKLFFTNHGVSNRPYSFDSQILNFDLFFMFGESERRIREDLGQLKKSNHALIGYPKYDFVKTIPRVKLFEKEKTTVIYNPHWLPSLTSYFDFGIEILDYFSKSEDYNLIFAPHSLLYARNKSIRIGLEKYKKFDNILIDLGSEYSNDMTYVKSADLFLGDISSQALEFLLIDLRPCLYLDAHNLIGSEGNEYISWQFGNVISDTVDMKRSIEQSFIDYEEKFKTIQEKKIGDIFFQGEESATVLAKNKINNFLRN